jgi:hypothetical protein
MSRAIRAPYWRSSLPEPVIHLFRARREACFLLFQDGQVLQMSRSPEAVRTLPATCGRATTEDSVALESSQEQGRRSAGAISRVAWLPQGEPGHAEWLATGRRLGAIGRCSQWWIGDWIRYGTSRWGERYTQAARVTGYDVASLRNMAWVASQFDLSLRSDKLTWSHHVLLAPLDSKEQEYWLERAHRERLSVADLRLELRSGRQGDGKASGTAVAEEKDGDPEALVCPNCGHTMPVPPGPADSN